MIIGIDSGSTMCKAVLFDGNGIADTYLINTGWNPGLSAKESLDTLFERNFLKAEDITVAATGYGRDAIDCADFVFTEITCHAYGGMLLVPEIQGVIDIGGQDSKVIQMQNGRVINFLMNDKCAAGTGRFLNMACETIGVSIGDIDNFADLNDSISITSMCTVFAESELIGLLAMQKERPQIMSGVLHSIAQKIRYMASKTNFSEGLPLLMTGGLSRSKVLADIISQTIGLEVFSHEKSLFAGALGACVCASKKLKD